MEPTQKLMKKDFNWFVPPYTPSTPGDDAKLSKNSR